MGVFSRRTNSGEFIQAELDMENILIPLGKIEGMKSVNKFGRAPAGIQSSKTDIWDRANASTTQQIWVAPTEARKHNISSGSASDSSAGIGAQKIKIYGLKTWDSPESSEEIIMNGATPVLSNDSYVIIHRMKLLEWGSNGSNVGNIIATAETDGTITAQINIGEGQTQMAIYGIPSGKKALITKYYSSAFKGSTSLGALFSLLVNQYVETELTGFLTKHTQGLATEGTSYIPHEFNPYFAVEGPAIIKLQAIGSVNDIDGSGGFDMILTDI